MTRRLAAFTLALSVVGCGDDARPADSGTTDAGPRDSGAIDAGLDAGATDAGPGDAGTDAAGMGFDAAGHTALTIIPDGCADGILLPAPGEEGHWSATVLTPASYPFTVTHVQYSLRNAVRAYTCHSDIPHRVQLFKGTTLTPDATPTVIAELDVALPTTTEDPIYLVRELPAPVVLNTGENLFVAFEMNGTFPDILCVTVCNDDSSAPDRAWWSNATDTPYPWARLADFGINTVFQVIAYGSP